MEKVKLTREQANALESLLEDYTKEEIIKENFNPIERLREYLDDENKNIVFRHLSDEMLVKALYFGYEVEEQYKKGDWVKLKDRNEAIKLSYDWMVDQARSEEHTSELQSRGHIVCRLLLEKKKKRRKPDEK